MVDINVWDWSIGKLFVLYNIDDGLFLDVVVWFIKLIWYLLVVDLKIVGICRNLYDLFNVFELDFEFVCV